MTLANDLGRAEGYGYVLCPAADVGSPDEALNSRVPPGYTWLSQSSEEQSVDERSLSSRPLSNAVFQIDI